MIGLRAVRVAVIAAVLAMPGAVAVAAVPIGIAATGHATVPVTTAAGTHQFVLDTGAEGSAVYEDYAPFAALESAGAADLTGQTGSASVKLVALPPLALDGKTAAAITAVVLPRRADGVALAGIVGLDLFGDMLLDFDLPARRAALFPSGRPPPELTGPAIAATPTQGGLLTVPVTIAGVAAVAVLDTGARKTRINWMLGRRLGLSPEKLATGDVIQGATNRPVETSVATVRDVRLGGRILSAVPVLVADLPVFGTFGVADRPAVILGLDWLDRTRMAIDFPLRKVWFQAADQRAHDR